jgi:hypothetical protein
MEQQNPVEICIDKAQSECSNCIIKGQLECQFRPKTLMRFAIGFLVAAVPAIIGMLLAGYGLFLLGWFAYAIFFLQIWENKILCAHCPNYAKKGRTIICHANYGLFKVWKFNPKPMSRWEKIQFISGASIFSCFPIPFLIIGRLYLLLFISLGGISIFWGVLVVKMCTRCLNFSCPINRVPKSLIDAFLVRNPIMREAWEEKGYKIEEARE